MEKTRVGLWCDSILLRPGIRKIIDHQEDLIITMEHKENRPPNSFENIDMLVIALGESSIITLNKVRELKRLGMHKKSIIFLSQSIGHEEVFDFVDAGVRIFLSIKSNQKDILGGLENMRLEQFHFSKEACYGNTLTEITNALFHNRNRIEVPRFSKLTTREKEVLKLLAEGNSLKNIASGLNLSIKTIEAHKFNLMRKLGIHNKAELIQYAIRKGVIKVDIETPYRTQPEIQ